jgi:MFS family permease
MARLAVAFAAFNVAEWATWVAMLVYAYDRGGPVASGLVAIIQLVPAAVFAPFGATLADRYPRRRFLTVAYLVQALAMAATATALAVDAPIGVVYVLAAIAATSITLTRPAQNGFLPTLATTPETLTRANALLSTIENASIVAGPALAGLLLSASGAGAVFSVMALWLALGALLVAGVREPMAAGAAPRVARGTDARRAIGMLVAQPGAVLLVALLGVQALQVGALDVIFVALALGVLHIGDTGVGLLTSAVGVGGIIGAITAGTIAVRGSPPLWMAIGSFVWGIGLMVIAPVPEALVVFALVIVAGAGRGLMDVAGRTLLQRAAPADILSRAFGLLEGISMAALAIGAGLAAILVERFGVAVAVAVVGALLPLLLIATLRWLLRLELSATARPLALLRALPLFAPLPTATLERLATLAEPIDAPSGTVIMREGDAGDYFYVIDTGEVEVSIAGLTVQQLGHGEAFGEIALLRNVPRTATVTARDAVRLYALWRDDFLEAARSRPTVARAPKAIYR